MSSDKVPNSDVPTELVPEAMDLEEVIEFIAQAHGDLRSDPHGERPFTDITLREFVEVTGLLNEEYAKVKDQLKDAEAWVQAIKEGLDRVEESRLFSENEANELRLEVSDLEAAMEQDINYPLCVHHLAEACAAEHCPYCIGELREKGLIE